MDPKTKQLKKVAVLLNTGAELSFEDIDYIRATELPVQLEQDKLSIKPQIPLGCDQLWPLIRDDQPSIQIPYGPHLLSRVSPYRTLQIFQPNDVHIGRKCINRKDRWKNCWYLNAQLNTVSSEEPTGSIDEKELWTKYWSLEAAGTEEYRRIYLSRKGCSVYSRRKGIEALPGNSRKKKGWTLGPLTMERDEHRVTNKHIGD
ncbi:hypothetical protein OESDEN_06754 [Oesophagostomum dentatum]|uniref:Uncharacterized protein n=1 Tax=Oesophagostomum dentatum TaxID=61180 RepID=A0A0B1T7V9_OESDE|nr:hypothetical protein OESDEN_06754 [Oesophagostomum dentatum]